MAAARRLSSQSNSVSSSAGRGVMSFDSVLTIDDLVRYLKLPKSTAYKLAQEGKIPGQKVGRHWRFHKTVIDQWLGGRQKTKGDCDGST